MAKFYGEVGYAIPHEKKPGVWVDNIVKKNYSGDVLQNMNRWEPSGQVNDNTTIDNKISIVSDSYANANFPRIRYIHWAGVNWKVNKIETLRPRLILSIGGAYNGPTT